VVAFVRLTRPPFLYGAFAGVGLGAALAGARGARVDLATYLWARFWHPTRVAFLGVGLYATTATGLAAAYAFAR
jgi:hypothetical protein